MAKARDIMLTPTMSDEWKELGGAANVIGWRFRACHEHMTEYVESWSTHGANISFEEMYHRERALFEMFSAGVSCIESTCYAINALASHPKLLNLLFSEREQRRCSPSRLYECLAKHDRARPLANSLDVLINSSEWVLWDGLRNRMIHRSNLPRIVQGAIGVEPPPAKALHFSATTSTPAFEEDVSHLDAMFSWLANSLRDLLLLAGRL